MQRRLTEQVHLSPDANAGRGRLAFSYSDQTAGPGPRPGPGLQDGESERRACPLSPVRKDLQAPTGSSEQRQEQLCHSLWEVRGRSEDEGKGEERDAPAQRRGESRSEKIAISRPPAAFLAAVAASAAGGRDLPERETTCLDLDQEDRWEIPTPLGGVSISLRQGGFLGLGMASSVACWNALAAQPLSLSFASPWGLVARLVIASLPMAVAGAFGFVRPQGPYGPHLERFLLVVARYWSRRHRCQLAEPNPARERLIRTLALTAQGREPAPQEAGDLSPSCSDSRSQEQQEQQEQQDNRNRDSRRRRRRWLPLPWPEREPEREPGSPEPEPALAGARMAPGREEQ